MKTKIINFLQKIKTFDLKKIWIITIFITAGIIAWAIIYNQHDQIQQVKAELLEKTLTDNQKKLVDIEKKKKENIDSLNVLRDEISERIKKQETIEKLQACYDQQVDRILNGQETDEEYCEELVQEEEKNEYNTRVDEAKKNCYNQKANRDLKGDDLINFCENPYRLNEFEKAPETNEEPKAPQTGKKETVSKKQPEPQNLDKKTFDIDKLAKAVAMHETADCKKWTGIKYDNCFWIRNWSIAPCKKVSSSWFCIYNTPGESYEAFKKIWTTSYGELPTLQMAIRWSWNDRAQIWKNNVLHFYFTK